jgi:hypothetical protein
VPLFPHWGWLPLEEYTETYWGFKDSAPGVEPVLADEMEWLTPADLASLGVAMERLSTTPTREVVASVEVTSHDDCFFAVRPVTEEILRAVLHSILRQHGHYLGLHARWDRHLSTVLEELKEKKLVCAERPGTLASNR